MFCYFLSILRLVRRVVKKQQIKKKAADYKYKKTTNDRKTIKKPTFFK